MCSHSKPEIKIKFHLCKTHISNFFFSCIFIIISPVKVACSKIKAFHPMKFSNFTTYVATFLSAFKCIEKSNITVWSCFEYSTVKSRLVNCFLAFFDRETKEYWFDYRESLPFFGGIRKMVFSYII